MNRLFAMLAVLALTACAQTDHEPTHQEKLWAVLHSIAVAPEYTEQMGLSERGIAPLVAYAKAAMSAQPTKGQEFSEGACAWKGKSGAEAIMRIENHQQDERPYKQKVVTDLAQILTADDAIRFNAWVKENVDPLVVETPKPGDLEDTASYAKGCQGLR